MDDYQPLYSRSQTRQTTYPGQNDSFQHRSGGGGYFGNDSLDSPLSLHTSVSRIITDIQRLTQKVDAQDVIIDELQKVNNILTARVESLEQGLDGVKVQGSKKNRPREGSNDHPALKVSMMNKHDCLTHG